MTPPTITPVWFEEVELAEFAELETKAVPVGVEEVETRAGEKIEDDFEEAELDVDPDADPEAEPVDDAVFEVLDGFTSVVTPSITKTPFLSLQHFSARVPFPQQ